MNGPVSKLARCAIYTRKSFRQAGEAGAGESVSITLLSEYLAHATPALSERKYLGLSTACRA
jgi:hypothetical protein